MRRPVAFVFAAALATALATAVPGCRTPPRKDLVEAELRVKDQDLREMRAELERTEAYNQYLEREMRNSQQATPYPAGVEAVSANRVKSIVLGRQTGGVDDDRLPGDEALQVVIEPRDGDNHTVKAPGMAQIHAMEITPEGVKKTLCSWPVDAETLRKSWRTGLLSTGYYLTLPWKNWPTTAKVRVVAQFVGQDERLFEAEKDVTVRLAPDAIRKMPPAEGPPLPLTPTPQEGDLLPPPRPVEPEKKEGPLTPSTSEKPYSAEPDRPLKGAVELLRPIVLGDN